MKKLDSWIYYGTVIILLLISDIIINAIHDFLPSVFKFIFNFILIFVSIYFFRKIITGLKK